MATPEEDRINLLLRQVAELSERVLRLERKLGASEPVESPAVALGSPPKEPAKLAPPLAPAVTPPPLLLPTPIEQPPLSKAHHPRWKQLLRNAAERRRAAGESALSFEQQLGRNWASWVGGLVLLVGVAFFLKYAWDQGWIRPSPAVRVMLAVGFGVAVSGVGEWLFRKAMRGLAASLHATGLAIVMTGFFGAAVYFDPPVLSRTTAGAGVVIACIAGIVLALRVDVQTVAILSLIGAYVSPAILSTGEDKSRELIAYLSLLAGLGLVLSYLRGHHDDRLPRRPWNGVRWLVLGATFLWLMLWWNRIGARNAHHTLAMLAAAGFGAAMLVEIVIASFRTRPAFRTSLPNVEEHLPLLSLATTACIIGFFTIVLDQGNDQLLAMVAVTLAAVHLLIAYLSPPRTMLIASILQMAALITLAVPLLLDRFSITVAWALLALVASALSWLLDLRFGRIWGIILLAFVTLRLIFLDSQDANLRAIVFRTFNQDVRLWLIYTWAAAVMMHLIAWMKPGGARIPALADWLADVAERKWPRPSADQSEERTILDYAPRSLTLGGIRVPMHDAVGAGLAWAGTALFIFASELQWSKWPMTLLAIAWLAPIVALARVGRQIGYGWHALLLARFISIRWLLVDGFWPLIRAWDRPVLDEFVPLFNPIVLNCLLLCGALVAAARDAKTIASFKWTAAPAKQMTSGRWVITGTAVWMGMLIFALLNFESWRTIDFIANRSPGFIRDVGMAKQMTMSVLWAVVGLIAVVIGFRKRIAGLRYAALALLAITLAKILIIDMADVERVWRIMSFIAVGALLLTVSYVYHRNKGDAPSQQSDIMRDKPA